MSLLGLIETCKKYGHTKLFLNYMNITEIPEEILEIRFLRELYLKRNLLRSLPNKINSLQSLVTLYVDSNLIEKIPEGIGDLRNLESLELNRNQMKELPSSICKLSKLRCLHLSHNNICRISDEIGALQKLEILNLMNNQITILPEEIGRCESLITLQLDGNRIQHLPNQLLRLCRLQDMSLSRNELQRIPNDIHHLMSLTNLTLDANKRLSVLPGSLIFMKKLKYLGLHNCIQEKTEEFDLSDSIASVMKSMNACWISCHENTALPLVEICMRFIGERLDECGMKDNRNFSLPLNLVSKLEHPIASCIKCNGMIFNFAFPIVKKKKQVWKMCDSLQNVFNHSMRDIIQMINDMFLLTFLFCSYKCLVNFENEIIQ